MPVRLHNHYSLQQPTKCERDEPVTERERGRCAAGHQVVAASRIDDLGQVGPLGEAEPHGCGEPDDRPREP